MRGKGRHATRDTSQGAFVPASLGGPGADAPASGGLAPRARAQPLTATPRARAQPLAAPPRELAAAYTARPTAFAPGSEPALGVTINPDPPSV